MMFPLTDPVDYELDADWSFGARARAAGADPAAMVYDVLLERDGTQLLYMPLFNFAHGNFDDICEMISTPFSLFGLSDAGAHCGAICDASMTTTSLVVWARDRKRGDAAPRRADRAPADAAHRAHVGWLDRGVVAPGLPRRPQHHRLRRARLPARPPRVRPARRRPPAHAGGRRLPHDDQGAAR